MNLTRNSEIANLRINVRTYNGLRRNGINTIGDLRKTSAEELLRYANFGAKSLEDIQMALAEEGLPAIRNQSTRPRLCPHCGGTL